MSTLKCDSIKSSDGNTDLLTLSNGSVSGVNFGRRNLIINGAMQVAQRGTSASLSDNTNEGYNTIDRWKIGIGSNGAATISQSTDAPDGFGYSYKAEVTTAISSVASGDFAQLLYLFEGQDLQNLKKGTSSAESLTLSFWVKTDVTGTYPVNFRDTDNSRLISGTYTVNSADTWEYKTITVVGDTSGAFDNDNASSLQLQWWLVAGSTYSSGTLDSSWNTRVAANDAAGQPNVFSTVGNYWQITGVQLEVGSVATPFEHRSIGEELALCQRYYQQPVSGNNQTLGMTSYYASSIVLGSFDLPVEMRTVPTISYSGFFSIRGPEDAFTTIGNYYSTTQRIGWINNSEVSGTAGDCYFTQTNSSDAKIMLDAEL